MLTTTRCSQKARGSYLPHRRSLSEGGREDRQLHTEALSESRSSPKRVHMLRYMAKNALGSRQVLRIYRLRPCSLCSQDNPDLAQTSEHMAPRFVQQLLRKPLCKKTILLRSQYRVGKLLHLGRKWRSRRLLRHSFVHLQMAG